MTAATAIAATALGIVEAVATDKAKAGFHRVYAFGHVTVTAALATTATALAHTAGWARLSAATARGTHNAGHLGVAAKDFFAAAFLLKRALVTHAFLAEVVFAIRRKKGIVTRCIAIRARPCGRALTTGRVAIIALIGALAWGLAVITAGAALAAKRGTAHFAVIAWCSAKACALFARRLRALLGHKIFIVFIRRIALVLCWALAHALFGRAAQTAIARLVFTLITGLARG